MDVRTGEEADQLLRRLTAAVEEDEELAPSVCLAVFLEHLAGPLADALVPHLHGALARGEAPQPLIAAYWRLVDASLAPLAESLRADEVAAGLRRLDAGEPPGGPPALGVLARAHAWRLQCARGEA